MIQYALLYFVKNIYLTIEYGHEKVHAFIVCIGVCIALKVRMAQLSRRENSCFEPLCSGFTRVQFTVKVKL